MMDSLFFMAITPYVTGGASTLIVLLIFVLIVYLLSAIIGKPFNLSFGPLKLNFANKKNNNLPIENIVEPNNIYIQKDTLFAEQIKTIIFDLVKKKTDLEYDTLRRQLNYAEDKIGDIKSIMSNTYTTLLQEKLSEEEKTNVKSHKEYKNYQMLLKIALNECVIKLMKKSFKANHLDEMGDLEWQKYVNHKNDTCIQQLSEFLDIMYDDSFSVTRQELSEGNDLHIESFKEEIEDILVNGREIYSKNKKKKAKLEDEIDSKIKELITNRNGDNI